MDRDDPRARAFRSAVESADAGAIRKVLTEHPELRAVLDAPWFAFGAPALVHLAGRGSREALDVVLDAGADPNARSDWAAGPYSALDRLVDRPDIDDALADHLIRRGAHLDVHAAAGLGRVDRLREILDERPDRVSEPGPDGAAPLHLARNVETAALLLERGAELEQRCVDHRSTPLMWSTQRDPALTRFLLERGARPDLFIAAVLDDAALAQRILEEEPDAIDVRVRYGHAHPHLGGGDKYVWSLDFADTPHEVARRRGHRRVLDVLLARSRPGLRMVMAARDGELQTLAGLAAHPPGLDALTEDDACACLLGTPEAARLLLERGVDPNARDDANGATAAHDAAWRGDRPRLDLLLEFGADLTVRDATYHATPLGWAAEAGHTDLVTYLAGRTRLDLLDACWLGDAERVREILVEDPAAVDGAPAASPLRCAAWHGRTDVVALLLERGADPAAPHPETGRTALDLARERGHTGVLRLLEG